MRISSFTLWIGLGALVSSSACFAAVINVPADYGTIQAAINAAAAGDTIQVAAGTYNESININKPLTLLGAQAGVDPVDGGRPGGESTISSTYAVSITASDVVFNGFEVTNFRFAINVPGPFPAPNYERANITINYNWLHSTAQTVTVGINSEPGLLRNFTISHNSIQVAPSAGEALAAIGLSSSTSADGHPTYENLVITHNEMRNPSGGYNLFSGADPATYRINGATIEWNYFHDSGVNYNLGNILNGTFSNNLIEDIGGSVGIDTGTVAGNTFRQGGFFNLWGTEYGFSRPSRNVTVRNNDFTDEVYGLGLSIRPGAFADTIPVHLNAFRNSGIAPSGDPINTPNGYIVRNLGIGTLDATQNWWGSAAGPSGNAGGIYGSVVTSPWILEYVDDSEKLTTPPWPVSLVMSVQPGFWPLLIERFTASCGFGSLDKDGLRCHAEATYCLVGGMPFCSTASTLEVSCDNGFGLFDPAADRKLLQNTLSLSSESHGDFALLRIFELSGTQPKEPATLRLESFKSFEASLDGACRIRPAR